MRSDAGHEAGITADKYIIIEPRDRHSSAEKERILSG
jgi:hypothetical protein